MKTYSKKILRQKKKDYISLAHLYYNMRHYEELNDDHISELIKNVNEIYKFYLDWDCYNSYKVNKGQSFAKNLMWGLLKELRHKYFDDSGCFGITLKGKRCKNRIDNSNANIQFYCHNHVWQEYYVPKETIKLVKSILIRDSANIVINYIGFKTKKEVEIYKSNNSYSR